jgi:uncharacterized protein DUF1016
MTGRIDKNDNITNENLFSDIKQIVDESRNLVAQTVNSTLSATYWHIGKRVNEEVLGNKRADYGRQIMQTLSALLIQEYGSNFSVNNLRRMMQFHVVYPDFQIVVSLIRQLSWTHFIALISLKIGLKYE